MYSPKIKEQFIPTLYKIARVNRLPMTRIVEHALTSYLQTINLLEIDHQFNQLQLDQLTKTNQETTKNEQ